MKKISFAAVISALMAVILMVFASAYDTGDVDGDGYVRISDARLALRGALKLVSLNDEQFAAADVNGDGRLAVDEARKILRVAVRIDTFGGATPSPDEPIDAKEIYKIASSYTVEINASCSGFTSIGSGFFISNDGTVVTNYHVIDGSYSINVIDYSGRKYPVKKIIAFDVLKDIAILKVDGSFDCAVLDTSAQQTGATVYTLGSSQGLTDTFTNGIISNPSRVVSDYNPSMTYIQITAPITHGNSGGPLINSRGEVIGINSWGLTDGQNLNFAIPAKYINTLDRSHPMTMEEFAALNQEQNSTEIYVLFDSATLKVGGSACLLVQVVDPVVDEYSLYYETNNKNIQCSWSDWLYNSDTGSYDTIFLFITAKDSVYNGKVTITMNECPSVSASVDISTSYYGSDTYVGEANVPDFGALFGVSPAEFYIDTEDYITTYTYDCAELYNAGIRDINIVRQYLDLVESYGYTYYAYDETDEYRMTLYYDYNNGVLIGYSEIFDDTGEYIDYISISVAYG